ATHSNGPWADTRLRLEDAAFRVQGTGSLGVSRFIFLARAGKKGEHFLIEAKEMRRSTIARAGLSTARSGSGGEAGRVERAMEALLSAGQMGVHAVAGKDGRSYLM